MKRVVIIGAQGQDGRILFESRAKTCAVVGLDVGTVTQYLAADVAPPGPVDLQSAEQVRALVERVVPDELYYLAAHHHSSEEHPDEGTELRKCADVNLFGLVNTLEAIRSRAPRCRLFYAGSSQMFGQPTTSPQNESTPFAPRNAYAITKVAGAHACAVYRERHGLHASVGILYNHESPLRGPRFVTQRIVRGAWSARRDPTSKLKLGSLSTVVDWGYAPDYVEAMTRIVSAQVPDDYVIATGEPHTVLDFVQIAFEAVGLDWRGYVVEDPTLVQANTAILVGNSTRLRGRTDWKPSVGFRQIVETLVRAAE